MASFDNQSLDNVIFFVRKLVELAGTAVGWTNDDFKNAFQWAKYCKKFSLKMKKLHMLDKCTETLAQMIPAVDVQQILSTLDDPFKALNKAMLLNPSLNKDMIEKLLNSNMTFSLDAFSDDFSRVVANNNIIDQMSRMPTDNSTEVEPFHVKLRRELCIAQLLETNRAGTSAIDEYVNYSCLDDRSMVELFENVIYLSTLNEDSAKQCSERIIARLIIICSTNSNAKSRIMNKENVNIPKVASNCKPFYDFYIEYLRGECELLFRDQQSIDTTWKNSVGHLSFQNLVKRWVELMNVGKSNGNATLGILRSFLLSSNNVVWLDIKEAVQSNNNVTGIE